MGFVSSGTMWPKALLCAGFCLAAQGAKGMEPDKCDDKGQWTTFRTAAIAHLLDPDKSGTSGGRTEYAKQVHDAVGTCKSKAGKSQEVEINACLARIDKLSEILARPGLGLNEPNDAYFKTHDKDLTIPDKLTDKELFTLLEAAHLSDLKSIEKVVNRIHALDKNAIVVPYISSSTPAIDDRFDPFGRIVVWMGGDLSHYIQFTVNAGANSKGKRIQASVVNFKDKVGAYVFDLDRDLVNVKFIPSKGGNNQKCYECHGSGVLAIHPFDPDEPNVADDVKISLRANKADVSWIKWVKELNTRYNANVVALNQQILKEYSPSLAVVGAPDRTLDGAFPKELVPDALIMPVASKDCTDEQKTAVKNLVPVGTLTTGQKVWDNVNYWTSWNPWKERWGYVPTKADEVAKRCTECHGANAAQPRGSTVFDQMSLNELMNKYVGLGYMPPNLDEYTKNAVLLPNKVDAAARAKAAECFTKAYYGPQGSLAQWLARTKCD